MATFEVTDDIYDIDTELFNEDEPALADGYAPTLRDYDTRITYGGQPEARRRLPQTRQHLRGIGTK